MPNNKSLPTDRRAEAEVGKKHGPKCWGRTSYSDEVAHCYCAELVERLYGPHEWGYRCPVEGGFIEDRAPYDAVAALEAAAEREGRLEQDRQSANQLLTHYASRATRAEAQVAALREALEPFAIKRVLEPNGVIVGLERLDFDRARQALSAIPTPGRS